MKRMVVIDGNSIMFRAYFATAAMGNLMQSRSGLYTNAIYGFVNMMQSLFNNYEFDNIFVGFDKGKKTVRHQAYADYKGGRKPTPEELLMQIPYIKEYLDVLNVKHLELDDYEADDIVGTMAVKASPSFDEVLVITGDRDLLQLAKGNIHVMITKKGVTEATIYTEENFFDLMGINSNQMVDYKALIGDKSDNLPGIPGVGEVTACKLLKEYQTLENIIAAGPTIKGSLGKKIVEGSANVFNVKKLATIYTDIDLGYEVSDTVYTKAKSSDLRKFYEKVDFKSFINKLPKDDEEKELVENVKLLDHYYFNDFNKFQEKYLSLTNDFLSMEVELSEENYHTANVLGLGIVLDNDGFFFNHDELVKEEVKEFLNTIDKKIYAIDIKKLYVSCGYLGINLKNLCFDLTLATYVDNPANGQEDVKSMFEHYLKTSLPFFEGIYTKKTKYVIPGEEVYGTYALNKASLLASYKEKLDEALKEKNQLSLLYEMEIPLSIVLADMEIAGFKIDQPRLEEIGKIFSEKMSNLQNEIYELCGEEFNISSPKQLGEILFEKLGLPGGKKNKTGYATGAEVLEKLANVHPVPSKVLEYRKYSKLYSTYVTGLIDVTNKEDGKLHTIFKQALTLTGRLSSTEPNIQNIPIRDDDGRIIRSSFIPSVEGGLLVSADYSQIELRILAAMSDCQEMLKAFNEGVDLHKKTASLIFQVEMDDVTKEMRRMAKAVNFGIVYGMSSWGLSEEVHISPADANRFIKRYFEVFNEIEDYLNKVVADAKRLNYTETMYHRRRYMPEINSSNFALRQFAERTAKNAPIQGSAADIIKLAMIMVHQKLNEQHLKSKLICQVHDELVIDTYPGEEEIVKTLLKETMENVVSLKVKLNAELAYGANWDMK